MTKPVRVGPSLAEHMSYRQFLIFKLLEAGSGIFTAIEAVASTALEHPDWDLNETKSLVEWEANESETH